MMRPQVVSSPLHLKNDARRKGYNLLSLPTYYKAEASIAYGFRVLQNDTWTTIPRSEFQHSLNVSSLPVQISAAILLLMRFPA